MASVARPAGPQWRDEEEPVDEAVNVWRWRYDAARQAELGHDAAQVFASGDQDIALLRVSAVKGCPLELLIEIFT